LLRSIATVNPLPAEKDLEDLMLRFGAEIAVSTRPPLSDAFELNSDLKKVLTLFDRPFSFDAPPPGIL
jgi:hypothetical protein